MDTNILFIIASSALAIAVIECVILALAVIRAHRKINLILRAGGSLSLEGNVKSHEAKLKEITDILQTHQDAMARIKNMARVSIQKVGMLRFNPFEDVGGDHSFSIAMLDSQNNGFVLTGLFLREGTRVYSKPIKNGVAEYQLSDEEKKALEKAMTNTNSQ